MASRASQSPRSRDGSTCFCMPRPARQATPTSVSATTRGQRGDGPQGARGERSSCALEEKWSRRQLPPGPRQRVGGSRGQGDPAPAASWAGRALRAYVPTARSGVLGLYLPQGDELSS